MWLPPLSGTLSHQSSATSHLWTALKKPENFSTRPMASSRVYSSLLLLAVSCCYSLKHSWESLNPSHIIAIKSSFGVYSGKYINSGFNRKFTKHHMLFDRSCFLNRTCCARVKGPFLHDKLWPKSTGSEVIKKNPAMFVRVTDKLKIQN